jgi:hypothetical protein
VCLVLAASGVDTRAPVRSPYGSTLGTIDRHVELAAIAGSWSSNWTVTGAKTEPTYVENVRISRRGDFFSLDADAFGESFGRIEMSVDDQGRIAVLACPRGASCDPNPAGFLATVPVLAAARRGQDLGRAPVLTYAGREVACAPAELLGGRTAAADSNGGPRADFHAAVDPCFDLATGAVFAQRSRNDESSFAGPTLDAATVVVRDCGAWVAPSPSGIMPLTATGRSSC